MRRVRRGPPPTSLLREGVCQHRGMPFIYCERCGSGCYSNVLSCPICGAPVGRVHTRRDDRHSPSQRRAAIDDEAAESEVRETLYGWHSGCVERVGSGA